MTMLEKMAWAIWANDVTDLRLEPDPKWTPAIRTHFMGLAAVALQAIREPGAAMKDLALAGGYEGAWEMHIDSILSEGGA